MLRAHVAVPADHARLWTERCQQREREADDALAAERNLSVEGVEELLANLGS